MTPMIEGLPDQIKKDLASTMLLPKRLGNPDEFAKLVQAIIENPFLNGKFTYFIIIGALITSVIVNFDYYHEYCHHLCYCCH